MPYVARSAVAGMEQTSVSLEEAAHNVGASRWTVTRRVVLPLVAANVVAGALLAFSFSMLEVSDSLLLAQRERDYPITKAIYTLYDRLGDGEIVASAMGVWAMALLAVTLLGASAIMGKRMGALFRA
jgi:iron(III) transport system permease protein